MGSHVAATPLSGPDGSLHLFHPTGVVVVVVVRCYRKSFIHVLPSAFILLLLHNSSTSFSFGRTENKLPQLQAAATRAPDYGNDA